MPEKKRPESQEKKERKPERKPERKGSRKAEIPAAGESRERKEGGKGKEIGEEVSVK